MEVFGMTLLFKCRRRISSLILLTLLATIVFNSIGCHGEADNAPEPDRPYKRIADWDTSPPG
jgi:hypothetical protein